MFDENKLSDMIACFLDCDRPDLVNYFKELLILLSDIESSSEDDMSSGEEEEYEIVKDKHGLYSLK